MEGKLPGATPSFNLREAIGKLLAQPTFLGLKEIKCDEKTTIAVPEGHYGILTDDVHDEYGHTAIQTSNVNQLCGRQLSCMQLDNLFFK